MAPNWLGAATDDAIQLVDNLANDVLMNAGSSMGNTFRSLWTFSNASAGWDMGPGRLTVTQTVPGPFSATMTSKPTGPLRLDPNGPQDLVVYFDVQGKAKDVVLDARKARRLTIELVGYDDTASHSEAEVEAWVLGHDPARRGLESRDLRTSLLERFCVFALKLSSCPTLLATHGFHAVCRRFLGRAGPSKLLEF